MLTSKGIKHTCQSETETTSYSISSIFESNFDSQKDCNLPMQYSEYDEYAECDY